MVEYEVNNGTSNGYLAVPTSGHGVGVLVLHAWWGLTPFFQSICDRLAREGFVALAPDLYNGATASTIEAAQQLLDALEFDAARARVLGAITYLSQHPSVRGSALGALGFSMGGAWALLLSGIMPQKFAAVVTFYGSGEADFAAARASYLLHYAEEDPWEPLDVVQGMESAMRAAGRQVTLHLYPGVQHWFMEDDRPAHFHAQAAQLAWSRTMEFLHHELDPVPS